MKIGICLDEQGSQCYLESGGYVREARGGKEYIQLNFPKIFERTF